MNKMVVVKILSLWKNTMKDFAKEGNKKILAGLLLSMIMAMAVCSFIIGKNQTPASADGRTIECSNNDTGDFEVAGKFMKRSL